MRHISLFAILVLAVFVAAGCGKFGKRYEASSTTDTGTEQRITSEKFNDANKKKYGCTDLKTYPAEGRTHTTDVNEKVKYKTNPPTSGNHYQTPAEWGIYDKQLKDVQTTHNLEHGHVLVEYKGLSDKQVDELVKQVKKNSYHLLVEPRDKNPKKGVYYTAWTAQIHCDEPSAAALQYIIDEYRDQGPELTTADTAMDPKNL